MKFESEKQLQGLLEHLRFTIKVSAIMIQALNDSTNTREEQKMIKRFSNRISRLFKDLTDWVSNCEAEFKPPNLDDIMKLDRPPLMDFLEHAAPLIKMVLDNENRTKKSR